MALVIPVSPRPEPRSFDRSVRKAGQRWLETRRIQRHRKRPAGTVLRPYWRLCIPDLYRVYDRTCAYAGVSFEWLLGAVTADHFVAKSQRPALAYEWANYRLACSRMNARKCDFATVLDPFTLRPETFRLELVLGRIYPNPALRVAARTRAQQTIAQLGLDDAECREMRARHYEDFRDGAYTAEFFARYSPFVYFEAKRQGLL